MFKKFHWGHGITIFYIFFVGMAATVLISSFGIDHSLVVDDYYAKDLAYQETYDKMSNNIASDNLAITYDKNKSMIALDFSDQESISGTVSFYRASDQSKDFSMPITSINQLIPTDKMIKGTWKVKVDWKDGSKSYYKVKDIYI